MALQAAEAVLARPVNPNVMMLAGWRRKSAQSNSLTARVAKSPRLFVLGSDDDLK